MCLLEKKTFSAAQAITTSTVFLCIFVCSLLFILCLGFRHLDQRKTTQMLKSLFLSQAITSPTEHHLPIPSSVQWLHMKWVKITNIKMSLKNYSIQNVLELIKICFIVQSISRVATLTCAKSTIEESILVDWDEKVYDANAASVTQLFLVLPHVCVVKHFTPRW